MASFYNPVRLLVGEGTFRELGRQAAAWGRRALLVVGRGAMRRTSRLDQALALLQENGLDTVVYEGVRPNPTDIGIREAAALARESACQVVIGLGGGSAMDTAKGVAVAATHDRDIDDFLLFGADGKKATPGPQTLPIICVTSTAGTSSQLTPFAVINAEQARVKTAMAGEAIFPRVAICDPELTYSAPPNVTAATGVDVLCHAIEAYFSRGASPVTDLCCERAVALVAQHLPQAVADGSNRAARRGMTEADIFAGYALSNCGGTICHALEHPLSAHYPNLVHGEGLAALLPAYARLFHDRAPERFARLAELLGAPVAGRSAREAAALLEGALRRLLEAVGLSVGLRDLGVQPDSLETIARDALYYNRGTLDRMPAVVGEAEVWAMLEASL